MRNKLMIGILCLTLAGLIPSPALAKKDSSAAKAEAPKPLTLEDHIQRGSAAIQKKDYKEAIKEYQDALKLDVKNAKANLLLGLTYANTGEIDKAIKYTMFSVATDPSYSAYHNLGLMYANKGDYKQSIEFHQKALAINPQSYRGWYQLGLVQQANSQFPEALASYQKAIDNNPKMTDAYIGMGGAYYWSGNMKAALEQVEALKRMGALDQASQLETWINNKEAKKNKGETKANAEAKAEAKTAAAAPAPAAEPAKPAAKPASK